MLREMTHAWPTDSTVATEDAIRPGDEIDVWCRSLRRWSSGFVALREDADGWRVRRRSDLSELPLAFSAMEIRRARR
jgi:hypothetical protein